MMRVSKLGRIGGVLLGLGLFAYSLLGEFSEDRARGLFALAGFAIAFAAVGGT